MLFSQVFQQHRSNGQGLSPCYQIRLWSHLSFIVFFVIKVFFSLLVNLNIQKYLINLSNHLRFWSCDLGYQSLTFFFLCQSCPSIHLREGIEKQISSVALLLASIYCLNFISLLKSLRFHIC